jgi:hypothetical protein
LYREITDEEASAFTAPLVFNHFLFGAILMARNRVPSAMTSFTALTSDDPDLHLRYWLLFPGVTTCNKPVNVMLVYDTQVPFDQQALGVSFLRGCNADDNVLMKAFTGYVLSLRTICL